MSQNVFLSKTVFHWTTGEDRLCAILKPQNILLQEAQSTEKTDKLGFLSPESFKQQFHEKQEALSISVSTIDDLYQREAFLVRLEIEKVRACL